jgi:hypothetical protein
MPPLPDLGIGDPDSLERRCAARLAGLGLPRSYFPRRSVLLIGGPAESALQYALWGADVTLVATDARLGEHAATLFSKHRQTLRLESREKLLAETASLSRFAFVACEEALLYSDDPRRDLDVLCSNLGRDAVLLVALPEAACGWRRGLMQRAVRRLGSDRDAMRRCAAEWFPRHVAATARARGMTPERALHEVFVEPRGRSLELAEICRVLAHHELALLGSSPSFRVPLAAGDPLDYVRHRAHLQAIERSWMTFGSEGIDWPGGDPIRRQTQVDAACAALHAIANRIAERDIDDRLLSRLDDPEGVEILDKLWVLVARQ